MTNDQRADNAQAALDAYGDARGENDTAETDMIDLISDLGHLARREGIDFRKVLLNAEVHYNVETLS